MTGSLTSQGDPITASIFQSWWLNMKPQTDQMTGNNQTKQYNNLIFGCLWCRRHLLVTSISVLPESDELLLLNSALGLMFDWSERTERRTAFPRSTSELQYFTPVREQSSAERFSESRSSVQGCFWGKSWLTVERVRVCWICTSFVWA